MQPSLELHSVHKRYGSVHALRGADFVLMPGQIHALLGENGAGKSTLMHVAYGMTRPDAGVIRIAGEPVTIRSPRDARARGIGMVHQHFTSVPTLSVAENITLAGGSPTPRSRATSGIMSRLSEGLDPGSLVESLSVALKQRLEIVKALAAGARILLLDEPTAVLAPVEIADLLNVVREFTATGGSVVLITHKLDEVFACAEGVTVLRHGQVTFTGQLEGQTEGTLAAAMIGAARTLEPMTPSNPTPAGDGEAVVRLRGVTIPPFEGRGPGLQNATLTVRSGELVGVAAIEGNGQRELMLGIAGVLRSASGSLEVQSPIALVAEDRMTEGLIPELTLTENLALGLAADVRWVHGPWLDWEAVRRRTAELLQAFDVRAPGPDIPAGMLSGGNQQKLVFARALEGHPRVMVVENPTRGLDLAATVAVHQRVRDVAAAGVAVLLYSSDLDEVLALGQRTVVVARGRLREMAAGASRDEIGAAMLGLATPSGAP